MKLLGKNKAFQDSFFNLQRIPTYMAPFHKSRWFLTDNEKAFEESKHKHQTLYTEEDVFYEFNRHGFRSIEFVHDPEAINVLVVGESNSIGVGLPFGEVWFNQLVDILREREGVTNVKMFNMSVSSVTLDQMSIMINQIYDVLKPDYVIVIGTSFFASSYFMSEDFGKSENFLHFSLTSIFDPPSGKITTDTTFMPPEVQGMAHSFTKDLNLANCFFKSLAAYSFIKRICRKNFLIYFRNPRVYNFKLFDEIEKYDSEFKEHFLDFSTPILSPGTCCAPNFARDGIHVGKDHHTQIANFIFNKLKTNGVIETWKTKFLTQ